MVNEYLRHFVEFAITDVNRKMPTYDYAEWYS